MVWEKICNRPRQYVAYLMLAQLAEVAQLISIGDNFMVTRAGETREGLPWSCTSGPPLRSAEGYQLSGLLKVSWYSTDGLQALEDQGVTSAEVTLHVDENERVWKARIDAFGRFSELYQRRIIVDQDEALMARALGRLLVACERPSGNGFCGNGVYKQWENKCASSLA